MVNCKWRLPAESQPDVLESWTSAVERAEGRDEAAAGSQADYCAFLRRHPVSPGVRLVAIADALAAADEQDRPLLHLYVSGCHVLITEVDSLHAPGRMWCGERIECLGPRVTYRLLSVPVLGAALRHHVPAAGRIVLERSLRVLRLHVEGDEITNAGRVPFAFDAY